MARRPADAKTDALKQHGCLNPRADAVRDELFLSNAFFDPRDLLQVKYEMLRRVREDAAPVSPRRGELRRLAAHLVPGAPRLRGRRPAGAVATATRPPAGPQAQ